MLDALANAAAIAANIVAWLPASHQIAKLGKRVLHEELRKTSSYSFGEALRILWPSRR